MPKNQQIPDHDRTSPVLSDAQRLDHLADLVRSMRVRLQKIGIAILNIGMLTAKSREIADLMVRQSIDILCLQETRWTGGKSGGKAKNIEEGIKLYYSGKGRPKNGVAICLKEEWQDKAIEVERKSDRIMNMKLVTPGRPITSCQPTHHNKGVKRKKKKDSGLNSGQY